MIEFMQEAMRRFNEIPDDVKEKILSNVYCTHCQAMVRIVDFTATISRGDLLLKGKCAQCSGDVARVIEGSERG